jgi:hypothetical protein
VELQRKGPGLLLRDILRGTDPKVAATIEVISKANPDVILLTGFDFDLGLAALNAYAGALSIAGAEYPFIYALRPNTGVATGLDLDGDGRLGGPGDAQGWGQFAGQGGMALLSRYPVDQAKSQDFTGYLWKDLPGSLMPGAGLTPAAQAIQRLSTTGHWDVALDLPDGKALHLLAFMASPPVFDGPEDRNGRRNHDEAAFWQGYIDGKLPMAPPDGAFVVLGDANLDPMDGDGRGDAMRALLADPHLQDPGPTSSGAFAAALSPINAGHRGEPGRATAVWDKPGQPGALRVDYVLPSVDLKVTGSGVFWPAAEEPDAALAEGASRHRLVWVDVVPP